MMLKTKLKFLLLCSNRAIILQVTRVWVCQLLLIDLVPPCCALIGVMENPDSELVIGQFQRMQPSHWLIKTSEYLSTSKVLCLVFL